jgi:hypothetical protein
METKERKPTPLAMKEFFVVVAGAFGTSSWAASHGRLPPVSGLITEHGLEFLLLYESVVLGILCGFLAARRWTFRQLGLVVTIKDTGIACRGSVDSKFCQSNRIRRDHGHFASIAISAVA